METKIIKKEENPVFSRIELDAEIAFDGKTLSRREIQAAIAEKISAKPELVSLRKIAQQFGSKDLRIRAHVYSTREELEKIEPKYILDRNAGKKGKETEAKVKTAQKSTEKA